MNPSDNETKEIINSFVSEGYERLEDAENKMQYIDGDNNQDVVNTVFRLFHSIKGSAGYLNFENIKHVTHEAETLLDLFRRKDIKPSQADVDLLYQTMDFLKQLIKNVETNFSDRGLEHETTLVVHSIEESIRQLSEDLTEQDSVTSIVSNGTPIEAPEKTKIVYDNLITPDMVKNFMVESMDLLDMSEKEILKLEKETGNVEIVQQIFRNIHTLKGNSGFFGFAFIETKSMEMENLLDSLRKKIVPVDNIVITSLLKMVDLIRLEIRTLDDSPGESLKILASEELGMQKEESILVSEYKPIGELLVDMGETTVEAVENALASRDKPIGEILIENGDVSPESVAKALQIQNKTAETVNQAQVFSPAEIQRKEIRVDTGKLDKLFDLVGELITAEAMVLNNQDLQDLKLDHFLKAGNSLNKISREIQEITMKIRMIPLDGLFSKMNRLVRDLSRKSGKKVVLEISGQDTEMDKNVIEQISDPLIHIIRNSMDHGLEPAEARKAAAKDETGKIRLAAKYEGNEIWISVSDDGDGLNREKILNKARERGLIAADAIELSDQAVWQFIFEPGFSTADQITEISGRGVGMDVVKKNLQKIRGSLDIKSEKGKGAEFVMKIPLTMAIIDGITVKVGNNHYSIPTNDILEFLKLKPEQIIETAEGNQVVFLRNETIPAIKLYQVFKVNTEIKELHEGIVIILIVQGKKVGVLIDQIVGSHQIVIKSISEYLGKIEGISGCSILSDGNISFILDPVSFVNRWLE